MWLQLSSNACCTCLLPGPHLVCRYKLQMELLKRQLEPFENMHHPLAADYIEVRGCTCQPLPFSCRVRWCSRCTPRPSSAASQVRVSPDCSCRPPEPPDQAGQRMQGGRQAGQGAGAQSGAAADVAAHQGAVGIPDLSARRGRLEGCHRLTRCSARFLALGMASSCEH